MAADDEGLRILERRDPPESGVNDAIVIGCSIAAGVFALGFAVTLLAGLSLAAYGPLLALALFLLAVAVRRFFVDRFPDVEATEPRGSFEDAAGVGGPWAAVQPVGRRPVLLRALVAASAVFGASLLALVPSLGPRVGDRLRRTPWRAGLPLVTRDDELIRPDDLASGSVLTAWPQGDIGFERAAVVVLRLNSEPLEPTNPDWVVDGTVVAYSKICTHAGCPVALFRERDDVLFCPCHQSTFDVKRGATPVFGPAARNLPQLPLGTDDEGYLIALGDFTEQAGPAFG